MESHTAATCQAQMHSGKLVRMLVAWMGVWSVLASPLLALTLTPEMGAADLLQAGKTIFYGEGYCATCHTFDGRGNRCTDLAGIGARAERRIQDASYRGRASTGSEYLVESLLNPGLYVVEGCQDIMVRLDLPRFGEVGLVALVAFLQSQGGQVTVDGHTRFPKWSLPTLTAAMTPADLVKAGEVLFYGEGYCLPCHTMGRGGVPCPDLAGIGAEAERRVQEPAYRGKARNGAEYLVESLLDPTAYVVQGYQPSMPPLRFWNQPVTDLHLVALVAFLQAQGSAVTVTAQTRFPTWRDPAGGAGGQAAVSPNDALPEALLEKWRCTACHRVKDAAKFIGPSLWDIGARKDAQAIRSALSAEAVGVPDYPQGLMKATLEGMGFYQQITPQELEQLVNYLASLKGGPVKPAR